MKIDESSIKFYAAWFSSKDDENLAKVLSNIVKQIQEAGKKLEEETKKIKEELKKSGIDMTDEDISKYGPALAKMVNDGVKGSKLKNKIEKLKGNIEESINMKILAESRRQRRLNESKIIITESMKSQFLLEAVCENEMMQEAISERLISEGWLGNVLSRVGNSLLNAGKRGIEVCTKYSIAPILSLGGIALGALTGGWGAELVIKAMYLIERNGKSIRNTFQRMMTVYANSKGVITSIDYSLEGDKDKKYSLRFYEKDMVWRLLNLSDQLKHPNRQYMKSILSSEIGKKYRQKLKSIWDPLFSDAKGGKIDFVKLLEQAKNVDIPEKALKLFQNFADKYHIISESCIEKPRIDTRTQSLKNDWAV